MTKFLLVSEDSEKENLLKEVFPMDEIATTSDEILIFDILKVEEPDIVIVDGDIETLDLKHLCRKVKQYPVVILMILGEKDLNKDVKYIKGVGPARADLLNSIGIFNLYDLITYKAICFC